jgi:hypothetical protein
MRGNARLEALLMIGATDNARRLLCSMRIRLTLDALMVLGATVNVNVFYARGFVYARSDACRL